ncbi:MAG: Nif3-like dinuclear metal center hexameric protein [Deltaproteobacteria bacterium]|nr:Nif3-like dinuclear metal center hexameric protein [Deltaproteobacteria bacterium]
MGIQARKILDWLEDRFPSQWAEDWDSVGLQVGDPAGMVHRVGLALEATPTAVRWALNEKIDLLLCHHPLIFKPLPRIETDREPGRTIGELLRGGLILWVAHTNLDAAPEGVSTALARRIGLQALRPLARTEGGLLKLVLFVPVGCEEIVQQALRRMPGVGRIGAYDYCSFTVRGEGRFTPGPGAQPFRGETGGESRTAESRLEMLVPPAVVERLLDRLRAVHPYEEMAFDLYPVRNPVPGAGLGRLGVFDPSLAWDDFIRVLKERTEAPVIQVSGAAPDRVAAVAVCGGSGRTAIPWARKAGAQVLLTGEVGYHPAVECQEAGPVLVTIGHYCSEKWILPELAGWLSRADQEQNWGVTIEVYLPPGDPYCRTV